MISIDSDIMRNISGNAAAAVQEVSSGTEKLLSITTHDDWNCYERDLINEKTLAIRKKITDLKSTTERYLDIINRTADRFDSADLNITKSFQEVQKRLGNALSVPTPKNDMLSGIKTTELKDKLTCGTTWMDAHKYYGLCEMDAPLKVCLFSDLDFTKNIGSVN